METKELRRRMRDLPPLPGGPVKPPDWLRWQREVRELVQSHDPVTFLAWPPIYHCMLVNHQLPAMQAGLAALQADQDWPLWRKACEMPAYGSPPDYVPGTPYSAALVHQAYHLHLWQERTDQKVSNLQTIVEVGGGFGACAYVARKIGFTGRYIIIDLPEFALLAEYVLGQWGVAAEFVTDGDYRHQTPCDLLIAMYSLSEMPLPEREAVLEGYPSSAYLLGYSTRFEEWDNLAWRKKLNERWQDWQVWDGPMLVPDDLYTCAWSVRSSFESITPPDHTAESAEQPAGPTAEQATKRPAQHRAQRAKRQTDVLPG